MSGPSNIEWTDCTWNPVVGCTRVSAGCDHCYAAGMTKRLEAMGQKPYAGLTHNGHFNGVVRCLPERLNDPLHWKKPRRVFVNSMSDLFHEGVPFDFIDKVFAVMALCPQHTFQILTKRPQRMAEYLTGVRDQVLGHATASSHWHAWAEVAWLGRASFEVPWSWHGETIRGPWPTRNVWLGTSIENQATADARIPHLLRCSAAVRFLSVEPLLGPIDFARCDPCPLLRWHCPQCDARIRERACPVCGREGHHGESIDWVILGGESGRKARPMHPDWARSIRDQCVAAGVPFFFKQWGMWRPQSEAIAGNPKPVGRGRNWGTLNNLGQWFATATPWNGRQDADSSDDGEVVMVNIGKAASGRVLDGRTWDEYPVTK